MSQHPTHPHHNQDRLPAPFPASSLLFETSFEYFSKNSGTAFVLLTRPEPHCACRKRQNLHCFPASANMVGTELLELFPWVYFHLVKYPGRRMAGSALSSALALSVPCAGQSRQDMKNPWNIYRHMWVLLKDGKQPWISLFGSKCPWSQHEGCPFRG